MYLAIAKMFETVNLTMKKHIKFSDKLNSAYKQPLLMVKDIALSDI